MKYLLLFLWGSPLFLFSQASKSISQTFSLDVAQSIAIHLSPSDIDIKQIEGSRILVETKIEVSTKNDRLLDFIIQGGRYDLVKSIDKQTRCLTLSPPKEIDVILIKGEKIKEKCSYIIYLPKKISLVDLVSKK